MRRLARSLWLPALLVVAWQAASMAGLLSPLFAPAPLVLVATALQMARSGELAAAVGSTLARTGVGFGIGAAIGFTAGMLMGAARGALRALDPLTSALNATPKLILLPLLFLLVGIGETARIVLVALTVMVIVAIHTADAVRHLRPGWLDLARNYGAGRRALFLDVYVPACLPEVFTGLRVALGNALVIAVSSELVSPSTGLGSVIWLAWQTFSVDRLYVAILTTAVLGSVLHEGLRLVERRLVPWRTPQHD